MTKDEALELAQEELENCADLLKVFEAPLDSCVGAAMLGAEKAITAIKQARSAPVQEPVAAKDWEGAEYWMPLAWELCADECGEEACTELIWEGGPIPEPWGDRWLKYEDEAKRLIALVQKHTTPPAAQPAPVQPVAYLFTNVQSGDTEASTNPDHKEGEREMWYREPLVRPPAAQRQHEDDK